VAVLEHAYYSVISPEGCAGILWKSAEHKADAATGAADAVGDLKEFGIVDAVIEEPPGGAHRDPRQMATRLKTWLVRTLRSLVDQPAESLVADRYDKFRRMGVFLEEAAG
jgi:acetyl-CoA carboxylase carboxyl transferase subunit alpha